MGYYKTFLTKEYIESKLLSNRLLDPKTNCWLWTKALGRSSNTSNGYGILRVNKHNYAVHRLSAWLWKGFSIESKLFICHKCDTPRCFNPEHLFVGSNADNIKDKCTKQRQSKGNQIWTAKLTPLDIQKIDYLITQGITQQEIANRYNIERSRISYIKSRKHWRHVPYGYDNKSYV